MAATLLGSLLVSLGLESGQFKSGLTDAERRAARAGDKMENLGRRVGTAAKAMVGLGAAIAGSQLVSQIKDMAVAGLEHASSLGEQAQQLGVTTSELQRYRFIATQVGIDQEVMDKGLAKLSITMGDLAAGAKAPTAALERLGFSQQRIAEISKMSAGEAIPVLADAFAKLKSPTEAAAIAADLFGAKMGGKFLTLLMGGKQGIDQLTESYKKLGLEITDGQIAKADEAMDKLAAMQEVMKARQAQVAVDNAEGIMAGLQAWEEFKTELIVVFGKIAKGTEELDKVLKDLADRIPDPYEAAGAAIDWLDNAYANAKASVIASTRQLFQGVKLWLQDKLQAVWDWLGKKIETAKQQFFNLYDAVVGHSYIPDMVDEIGVEMRRLDDVMVKPIEKATKAGTEAFRQMQQDLRGLLDRLFPDQAALAANARDFAILEWGRKTGKINRDTFNASADALANERPRGDVPDAASVLAAIPPDALSSIEGIDAALASISEGLPQVSVKWDALSEALRDRGRDAFESLSHHIQGVLLGFESLGDAVRGLIAELAQMAIQQFLIKPLGMALGVPGFANGTNFAPGGLAVVGERGPELVNLPRGSQVIPNHQTSQMMGGVTHSPNFYFPGITDARGAREAATQAARRYRAEINGPLR